MLTATLSQYLSILHCTVQGLKYLTWSESDLLIQMNTDIGSLGSQSIFFFEFWWTWVLFVGPLIPLFWIWCRLPWVSKPGWILRFTSGATPADCIEVSMAAGRVPYILVAEVGWRDSIGRPPAYEFFTINGLAVSARSGKSEFYLFVL